MSWAMVILLGALAFAALAFLLKAPRSGWEAIGAALLLGIAGYALQGSPSQPGAPKMPAAQGNGNANSAALVAARQQLRDSSAAGASNWLVIGDAMARNGQYGDAAGVLLGAVEQNPDDVEGWLALGNALVGHAEGALTPASLHAYQRAANADPDHPGPPFFLGLALAQNGRLTEARALWAELLARSPKDAAWRDDLVQRLARLDQFIAANGAS
jgi:cytochrome c-type biogenesis protein CcmH